MNKNKSGQTALILVIVTMVTALGIGIASSTQSNVNLRNTVYSTQSEQALACAEAGAEEAFGRLTVSDPSGNGTASVPLNGVGTFTDTCSFDYDVTAYPAGGGSGEVKIPNLVENSVQELYYGSIGANTLNFSVNSLGSNDAVTLAVYLYKTDGTVERQFHWVGDNASNNPNDDFTESGPDFTVSVSGDTEYIRLRPLYANLDITIDNYPQTTGYFIESTGTAGSVKRVVNAYRYYSQLPAAFDEAVVMLAN